MAPRVWLAIARQRRIAWRRSARHASLCAMAEALLHAMDRHVEAFTAACARVDPEDVGRPAIEVVRYLADHLAQNGEESRWQLAPAVSDPANPLQAQVARWPSLQGHVPTRL